MDRPLLSGQTDLPRNYTKNRQPQRVCHSISCGVPALAIRYVSGGVVILSDGRSYGAGICTFETTFEYALSWLLEFTAVVA